MSTIRILFFSLDRKTGDIFHQVFIANFPDFLHIIIIYTLRIDVHLSFIIIIILGHQTAIILILIIIIWPLQSLNQLVLSTITYIISSTFNKQICQ